SSCYKLPHSTILRHLANGPLLDSSLHSERQSKITCHAEVPEASHPLDNQLNLKLLAFDIPELALRIAEVLDAVVGDQHVLFQAHDAPVGHHHVQLQREDIAHLHRQFADARVPLPARPQHGGPVVGHAAQQVAKGV